MTGFLDRYTSKIEKYWKDNYETTIHPIIDEGEQYYGQLADQDTKEKPEFIVGTAKKHSEPTLPKTKNNSLETPKKKPRKAKKED